MRVVVADDSALLRDGVTGLLAKAGHEIAGSCGDTTALLALVADKQPDVAVVDVRMPPTHTTEGLQAAHRIRHEHPKTAVLLLSQHIETAYLADLLADGGHHVGYLLKDRIADVGDFLAAVDRVADGGTVIDHEVIARLLAKRRAADRLELLSQRERDVLALMAEGQSNAAIAQQLVVSERTVETHIRSVLQKLDIDTSTDVHRRVLAVIRYLRTG